MLSISKAIKAGQGDYYLSLSATDDYYLTGTEPAGFWLGAGATSLGLSGPVEPEHFRNLLQGLSPGGEKKLVRNADSERRAGWDLTWSVPKSVSVAWSQAEPEVQRRIEACVRQAVAVGVNYLEEVAGITRRGEDGHIREKGQLLFACFQHSTSRAQDPQLHIHSILNNVAVRSDGTTGTVEPREIYRHQHAADSLFRAELAALLERELGLRSMREGRAFELIGVDRELMEVFSTRRAQVLEALQRRGLSGAKAAEIAALDTRPQKEKVSRDELFARWQQTGRDHGWTAKELSFLLDAQFPARDFAREVRETGTTALAELTWSKSHFTMRELTQAVGDAAQGRGLGAKEVAEIREQLLRSTELVCLGAHRGEQHWTTREVLAVENRLLSHCELLHQREFLFPTAPSGLEAVAEAHELSKEQRVALQHVCEATGGIRVVSGLAGTGKSTLFRAARKVWEAQGINVLGATLSGKAARGLEESTGIPSQTLHRMLYDMQRGLLALTDKSVLLIDEAAMVGTSQLAAVAARCVEAGATLVLTGDAKQLQAIEFGGAFAVISQRYGAVELCEIRRQREEWARNAVKNFSAGDAEKGLSAFAQRGMVVETEDGWGAMDRLIAEWSQEATSGDHDTVILASTNAEVTALNHLAQEARRATGSLGADGRAVGNEEVFSGDRVLFTRNALALSVMNGDRGVVRNVVENRITVQLDSGALICVDLESYPHLRLGYAMTTHKSQGMTVEKAFILVSDQMVNREISYVQASRARGETRWYVGKELEAAARSMEKSFQKQMASTFDLWAQPGPELELTLQR